MRGDIILVGLGPHARANYIPLIEDAPSPAVEHPPSMSSSSSARETCGCDGEDVLTALAGLGAKIIVDRAEDPFGLCSRGSWT